MRELGNKARVRCYAISHLQMPLLRWPTCMNKQVKNLHELHVSLLSNCHVHDHHRKLTRSTTTTRGSKLIMRGGEEGRGYQRVSSMTSNQSPAFAYTVVYVKDVAESVAFYAKAFGYAVRRLDESHRWGELESGKTTIAFTLIHQHETNDLTGTVHTARSSQERPPIEVCFVYPDVDAAYKRAVENGAVPVSKPELKEWGQKVGYVRDIDGNVIRMGSHVNPPKQE